MIRKKQISYSIINLDKPAGMTCKEIDKLVKDKFGCKKTGHTGTLDFNATGVLLICCDEALKAMPLLVGMDKEYEGLMYLHKDIALKDLRKIIKQPLFVPESALALKVLELFKQSGIHFALLIDEYGGCQGVVTLKDILEAIVGEMPELGEPTEPTVVQLEDGSWILDGTLVVDEFKEILNIYDLPEDEPKRYYHTLGGFIMKQMGRIPRAGEHFEWKELRFEVKNMDGNRVDKVIIQPLKKEKL